MPDSNNRLVCIIDDDPAVRAATNSLVRSLGWEVRDFTSAGEFLASDVLHRLDCLVCDVQMPVMDGVELLERLEREGIRVPTILMTGYVSHHVRQRIRGSSALCLLEKPIDASDLEAWIDLALHRQ